MVISKTLAKTIHSTTFYKALDSAEHFLRTEIASPYNLEFIYWVRVAQNTPKVKNDLFPHSLRFLGHHRWDIGKKNHNSMKP